MASRLPRSFPSAVNVDPAGIAAFLDALSSTELHSLMIARHGKVIAEAWWRPYRADELQLGYSLTKSFTSVALSYAVAEGLVSMGDVVPEVLGVDPATVDPRYSHVTVRDLARMTTGHYTDPLDHRAWPPLDGEPGQVWIYNNWASHTLGQVVQRVTGRSITGWLEPRLFEPLDIEDWAWHESDGAQWGFSGLHLATESWAKFGHLLLRGGELFDRQVIDEGYLAAATSKQADNSVEPDGAERATGPDWKQGYGYQFWRNQHGFRGDGAYGQFVVVLPEQDLVLVTTAATDNMQAILTAAWDHLLPAVGDDARRRDEGVPTPEDDKLAARLASASLPPLSSRAPDQAATFRADHGNEALASVSQLAASSEDGVWTLTLWLPEGTVTLQAGDRSWLTGDLPGSECGTMPVGASAGWTSDDTFEVELRSLQTPHGVRVVCDLDSGTFTSRWLTEPLGASEFRQLALAPGLRRKR